MLIRIQECSEQEGIFQAKVSFDQGLEYDVTIHDPFSEEEEGRLEWYFEEHLKFPFTAQVKAQEAATSIIKYGEILFAQVFSSEPQILSEYKAAVKVGVHSVQIEIIGQPSFHVLHWETLKDPEHALPLALQATIIRKNLSHQTVHVNTQPSPTINLLVITARPRGKQDIGYRTISRPLVESLRQDKLPVKIDILRPGTYRALENHLRATTEQYGVGYYHVIHFDVHGTVEPYPLIRHLIYERYGRNKLQPYEGVKAFLFLEGEKENTADPVEATELAKLLIAHHVPIVVLNACQSGKQIGASETSLGSHLVQAGIQSVLAMGYSVTVSAAQLMMTTLYEHLFSGDDLPVSMLHTRTELYNNKKRRAYFEQQIDLEDWLLPVVYQNQSVPLTPRKFIQQERNTWFEHQAEEERYTPPEPQYGFVGRDLDILQIEKCLLTKRNILLIRGMGGFGKTTLLKELAAWWHKTGFVQRVFYFGYDEKAWTCQQIVTQIAQQLYGPRYYSDFQPLSFSAQQAVLVKDLRAANHLLILDNLESIIGEQLQHTLPQDEQQALQIFLRSLALNNLTSSNAASASTRILLGSRGSETWLAQGTFDDNTYDLDRLDDEATSILVNRVLERNHATKYRDNEELRTIAKILDGCPLALEVVLTNLARQTPKEVLAALKTGNEKIDSESTNQHSESIFTEKTRSILRCISYSHSNLSPEVKQLLLCLAPFTTVLNLKAPTNLNFLDRYTYHLKRQPALTYLSFERLSEAIQEAQYWALLTQYFPGTMHLHPILPYFLRVRLNEPGQVEVREAIETAFYHYYEELSEYLGTLFHSKNPEGKLFAQGLTQIEYENIASALDLALRDQVSFISLYDSLYYYLDLTQDHQRGLELGQKVLSLLEDYPTEKLSGRLGEERVIVITNIARQQYHLKMYEAAEATYQKALALLAHSTEMDEDVLKRVRASIYLGLGQLAQGQGKWKEAEGYCQEALQLNKETNDREEQARIYHLLGLAAKTQREWGKAEAYNRAALQIWIESNDRYKQAGIYHNLAVIVQEQKRWKEVEAYYRAALQIWIESNDRHAMAVTFYQLGRVSQEQEQWEEAEAYWKLALQICIESNISFEQAAIYHQLSMVAYEQEQWEEAEAYCRKALQICIKHNSLFDQARIYHQLSRVAQMQQKWKEAQGYYQQALHIEREANDFYSQAVTSDQLTEIEDVLHGTLESETDDRSDQVLTYRQLGMDAFQQEKWEEAERYWKLALQICIEANILSEQARINHQLGQLASIQQQWEGAERYFQQALQICVETNDHYHQYGIQHDLGVLAQQQQQWEEAERCYQRALQICMENNIRFDQGRLYYQLGQVVQAQGHGDEARDYFLRALEVSVADSGKAPYNVFYSLAQLWQESGDVNLPSIVASIVKAAPTEIEDVFRRSLNPETDGRNQALTYYQLGIVAQERQQWEEAERYYQRALQICMEANILSEQASINSQLGQLASTQQQWEEAERYYQRALQICIEANILSEQARINHQLGQLASIQQQWETPSR